jgi:hypothetical protein
LEIFAEDDNRFKINTFLDFRAFWRVLLQGPDPIVGEPLGPQNTSYPPYIAGAACAKKRAAINDTESNVILGFT